MMIVLTAFDYNQNPPKPLITYINDNQNVKVYPLFIRGTKRTIYDVEQDIKTISKQIDMQTEGVLLNDAKSHIQTFSLTKNDLYQLNPTIPSTLSQEQYLVVFNAIASNNNKLDKWRLLLGTASRAYISMEEREIYLDETLVHPRYTLDTFSGRSRCHDFNMQGLSDNTMIRTNIDDLFVCFDWIAADIRAASMLSGDKTLLDSFKTSDPHTMLSKELDVDRAKCKIALMGAIYSLKLDSQILELFPTLREWMRNQLEKLDSDGCLSSPLGRVFRIGKGRDRKSVFNAVIQGTVAHAMQSCLASINELVGKYFFTETHDGIIISCRAGLIQHVVKAVSDAMIKPIESLDTFPFRISIGKSWKKWKLYKECR